MRCDSPSFASASIPCFRAERGLDAPLAIRCELGGEETGGGHTRTPSAAGSSTGLGLRAPHAWKSASAHVRATSKGPSKSAGRSLSTEGD